jgi:hypothetical protein
MTNPALQHERNQVAADLGIPPEAMYPADLYEMAALAALTEARDAERHGGGTPDERNALLRAQVYATLYLARVTQDGQP